MEILHTPICKGIALAKEVMVNVQVCIMSLGNLLKPCLVSMHFPFAAKFTKVVQIAKEMDSYIAKYL